MAKRRPNANGQGSIYLRKDTGRYRALLTVGWTASGNAKRYSRDFETHADAEAWLLQQRAALGRGELVIPQDETLAERATAWLEAKRRSVRAGTHRDYEETLNRLVLKHLGGVRLKDLRPAHVDALLTTLHDAGSSAYALSKAHRYLSMVLSDAVRLELIPRNVAASVKAPRHTPAQRARWSPEEAGRALTYCQAQDHPVARYIILGLVSGLRREELLGLRWQDVTRSSVHVRQTVTYLSSRATINATPKTAAGHRTVHLDAVGMTALAGQREYVELARSTAKDKWREHDLVFPSSVGTPLSERYLREHFRRLVEEAGVPVIRLYDLRATHGSILAAAGMNPRLLSERLGHADVAFTMRTYVRTLEVEAREAASVFTSEVQPGATGIGTPDPEPAGGAADKPVQGGEVPSGAVIPPDVN